MIRFLSIALCVLIAVPAFGGGMVKQSTAVIVKMGPFVDATDFVTPETGLAPIAQADIQISKNGAAFAQTSEASPTTTHDVDGFYPIPLTATDTGTLGRIQVQLTVSGALPVWWSAMVVPAAVYDSQVLGTDVLPVDVTQVEGTDATTYYETRTLAAADYFLFGSDDVAVVTLTSTATDVTNDVTTDTASRDASKATGFSTPTNVTDAHSTTDTLIGNRSLATADYFLFGSDDVTLANGAHGGAAATLTLSSYTNFLATGFATPTNVTDAHSTTDTLLTNRTRLDADYFSWASDTVANVTLTATTTDVTNGVTASTVSDKTGYALSTAGIDAIWDEAQAGHVGAGSFGLYLDTEVSGVGGGSAADIADAVWDETQSEHTSGGTFGFYVDAKISDATGGGAGSVPYTWTETDFTSGDPIADALIEMYTDAEGTNFVTSARTNNFGIATFQIQPGTYQLFRSKSGRVFSNPTQVSPSL